MNIEKMTLKAQEALQQAKNLADEKYHPEIDVEHLVLALIRQENGVVFPLLNRLGVSAEKTAGCIQDELAKKPQVQGQASRGISQALNRVFEKAFVRAREMGDEFVSTEHLFLAGLEGKGDLLSRVLAEEGITLDGALEALQSVRGNQRVTDQTPEDKYQALEKYGRDLTEAARTGKPDPVIGRDEEIRRVIQVLSRRMKNNPVLIGEPGVGKTAIAEGLAQRIVAGDVPDGLRGKRVISMDLGSMLAGAKYRGEFEDRFKAFLKEVVASDGAIVLFIDELHTLVGAGGSEGAVDASNMIKPSLARGELHCIGATTFDEYRKYIEKDAALERRFQPVLVEEPTVEDTIGILRGLRERYEVHHGVRIQDSALVAAATLSSRYINDRFLPDKAIDLVDEAGSQLRMEIDSMPAEIDAIQRRIMQLEIEREALRKESDGDARERLGSLEEELSRHQEDQAGKKLHWEKEKELIQELRGLNEALDVLRGEEEKAKRGNNLERVAELLYGQIPAVQKQIEGIQQRLAGLQGGQRMLKEEVTADEVAQVISHWTKVPVSRLLEGGREKLLHMEERLRNRLIGQDEAVSAVANAVRRARAGLQDPNRPLGSFLFMGPTGVGKTELAKTLAEDLFDDEDALIRIDMSEYMEKHSVSRLLGAPPGYVGYDEGGTLTEQVRRRPYSVILFDEVEKAHPDVVNVLLQFLDDGRLTDGQGRTVNFTNTLVIMTSNLGGDLIQEAMIEGTGPADMRDIEARVHQVLRGFFRPEFLNRLDEIIFFRPLTQEQLHAIVDIQLARVQGYLDEKHIRLEVTDAARHLLAEAGYDPVFGARPLKRVIQRKVLDELSECLLGESVVEGDEVVADLDPTRIGRLLFTPRPDTVRQSA